MGDHAVHLNGMPAVFAIQYIVNKRTRPAAFIDSLFIDRVCSRVIVNEL